MKFGSCLTSPDCGLSVNDLIPHSIRATYHRCGIAWINHHSPFRRRCLFALLLWGFASSVNSDESLPPLKSGPELGSEVTSFYVRAVTGPHAGKSVCYVCRNGDRPVVMVLLRELGPDTTRLLKQLDATVNKRRADGLRCFVVLLSDTTQKDLPRLQTLAFDEKLDLPLTLAPEALTGPTLKSVSSDAAVTVVLYDHLKVTNRFSFRTGECRESACEAVLTAAERLADDSSM